MHTYMKALTVLSLLVLSVVPLQAQSLPWTMGVDSSLRVELLIGSQTIGESRPVEDHFDRFKFISNQSFPVLSGSVELSPLPWVSGRLAGALSVLEPTREISVSVGGTIADGESGRWAGRWEAKPHYSYWEAAGLYHLANGGGYRFSAVAGYRGKTWKYYGEDSTSSSDRNKFQSYIPFLGLQTSMYFPLWKARFELLGSPFMKTDVYSSLNSRRLNSGKFHLESNRGGMIEFQMEGSLSLSKSVLCGLSARLSYEELYGPLDWTSGEPGHRLVDQAAMDAHLIELISFFGLNATILF